MELPEKEDLTDQQQKLFKTSIFISKLIVAGILFRGILYLYPDTTSLQAFMAEIVGASLGLTGIEATVNGIFIQTSKAVYLISQDCLGWKSVAAFTALVYASPRKGYRVLAWAIPLILGFNILRVVTTVHLSQYTSLSFNFVHGIFWRWSLTSLILILWISWLYKEKIGLEEVLKIRTWKV